MTAQKKIVEIKKEINRLIHDTDVNILSMQYSDNPQVKEMVVKNLGYRMALEDIQEFMLNKHI
jgi:hypothetical protein